MRPQPGGGLKAIRGRRGNEAADWPLIARRGSIRARNDARLLRDPVSPRTDEERRPVSVDKILSSFRPGEIIDDLQIEELKRWRLLDFRPEPDDDHTSHASIVVVCGCGRSGTTLARVMLDTHPELYAGPESLVFLPVPVDAGDLARKFDLGEREVQALHEGTPSRARFAERFKDLVLLLIPQHYP
jgi:hypothetical protein